MSRTREQALVDKLDGLLACYRIGTTPSETLLDEIARLRAEVAVRSVEVRR